MAMGPKRRLRMQVRATPDNGPGTGKAVVSVIGLEYDIGWGWTEVILAGCFDESIADHPTIPIYHQHNWDDGPIGSGAPSIEGDQLVVTFGLYLGMGDLVDRVYRGMQDKALEEWSIGFWADEITWEKDNPSCDQIAKGDLAEASVCVRGANPETGTLELAARGAGWIMGDEPARERELSRIRSLFPGAADLRKPRDADPTPPEPKSRAVGDDDEPTPADLAQSLDALIDQVVVLLETDPPDTKGALDLLTGADSTCDDLLEALGVPDDDEVAEAERGRRQRADVDAEVICQNDSCGHSASLHADVDAGDNTGACSSPGCGCSGMSTGDPADDESSRARLLSTPLGRRLLAHSKGSKP